MNKMLTLAMLLVMSTVGMVFAEQTFTTTDGVFSVVLPDGQVQQIGILHRVVDLNNTEAVGVMEVVDNNGTPESNSTENLVKSVLAQSNSPVLLSDVEGTYSGFKGRQFSFTMTNDVGTRLLETVRAWTSESGHTIYSVVVVEIATTPNQSRVEWYLNQAVFHPEHFAN